MNVLEQAVEGVKVRQWYTLESKLWTELGFLPALYTCCVADLSGSVVQEATGLAAQVSRRLSALSTHL